MLLRIRPRKAKIKDIFFVGTIGKAPPEGGADTRWTLVIDCGLLAVLPVLLGEVAGKERHVLVEPILLRSLPNGTQGRCRNIEDFSHTPELGLPESESVVLDFGGREEDPFHFLPESIPHPEGLALAGRVDGNGDVMPCGENRLYGRHESVAAEVLPGAFVDLDPVGLVGQQSTGLEDLKLLRLGESLRFFLLHFIALSYSGAHLVSPPSILEFPMVHSYIMQLLCQWVNGLHPKGSKLLDTWF